MFLLSIGLSRIMSKLSLISSLKLLLAVAYTEKSSKVTWWLHTSMWSLTAEVLAELVLLPVRWDTPVSKFISKFILLPLKIQLK